VRGFLIGLVFLMVVVLSVLSIRPGGFRHQLRNVARRLKLALILSGAYLVGSTAIRLAFPNGGGGEVAMIALAAALAIAFLVIGQDRPLDQR